jgi:hypothetical protein
MTSSTDLSSEGSRSSEVLVAQPRRKTLPRLEIELTVRLHRLDPNRCYCKRERYHEARASSIKFSQPLLDNANEANQLSR